MDLDRVNELGFEKTPKWHSVILLVAFNKWWNIFIGIQCFVTFLMSTYTVALQIRDDTIATLRYIMDGIYFFEIVCVITYRVNSKIKKMTYVKERHWFFIIIDIISVIPFELIYFCYGIRANLNVTVHVWLIQNRGLRIYRIVLLEFYYETLARKFIHYINLMMFGFTFRLFVVSHLLCCFWIMVEDTVGCDPHELKCFIWCECHMIDLVLLNWSGKKDTLQNPWERFIASAAMLFGFLLIFAYSYPKVFYFGMLMFYKEAVYYKKLLELGAFFRNMVPDRKLRSKISNHFAEVRKKEVVEDDLVELFEHIPLPLKKDIFTDIHWEAFQHSDLFREVSRSCKRSLSLRMKTEYYRSGEVIYYEKEEKIKMMFLFEGNVQIMAEENPQFPLLSFSDGTILGEVCLFYYLTSGAILKCQTQSKIQVLTMRDAVSVLKDYPKDRKLVFHYLCERLKIAKCTQWRKKKFGNENKIQFLPQEKSTDVDCVKWLKKQWRSISDAHKQYSKLNEAEKQSFPLRDNHEVEIKIDYVSNYLDLFVLSGFFQERKDRVCFRTSFPWSMNPSCQFFRVWYYIVLVTSLIPAFVYPFFTAWTLKFPRWVYYLSFLVTLVFITDVFLKLFTAIITKHSIITKFFVVLRHLVQKFTFYLDVIAAFPYQIIVHGKNIDAVESYDIGLALHPAILKFYVFILLEVPVGKYFDIITIFKNLVIYFLVLYWAAAVLQLFGVRDLIETEHEWFDEFYEEKNRSETLNEDYVSVITTVVLALSIPECLMAKTDIAIMISCTITKYFFALYMGYVIKELFAVRAVKIYGPATFLIIMRRISKFLKSMYVSERLTERLLKSSRFQWKYDKANYLTSKKSIITTIPPHLRQQIYCKTTYRTLQSCPIFQCESLDFLIDVMEKSYIVAVPRGSVLVTFGHICHLMSILHRGYCRMNSYLVRDVHAKLGRSIEITRGQIFPVLSCLYCIPSPVSVVTTTDCEVIMIQLDDLLNVMVKHNIFKDMTDTLLELNFEKCLRCVEPGLLKVKMCKSPVDIGKAAFRKGLIRGGFLWKLMFWFTPSKNFWKGNVFEYWTSFYVLYLIVACCLWPMCFGLLVKSSHVLIPTLTGAKFISLVHLVLRFCFPYYNKKGLLVSHPVFTALHYLSSSFITDLYIAVPVYAIYLYGFNGPRKQPHYVAILFLFVQLFFKMNYIVGSLNDLNRLFFSKNFMRILKIVLVLVLTFNMCVNFTMHQYTKWIFDDSYRVVAFEPLPRRYPNDTNLLRNNSSSDYYVFTAYWVLSCLTTTDYLLHEVSGYQLFYSYIQAFVGIFGSLFLYVWVASHSIFSNIQGTLFQEKVFSLISYLKYEKVNKGLIDYVKSFYNYEWMQTYGEKLRKLCDHLPLYLREELVYTMYRQTFCRNKIFTGADEGFFKILATKTDSVFFNRGSTIMFQNEVQSNIFFVHKGKCFVYDWFLVLDNGSIIGDIHQTGVMRNTVYALTNVQLLTISSDEFFNILNRFYTLEANFLYCVKTAENFVNSNVRRSGQQLRPVDSKDVLKAFCLKKKQLGFEDKSFFEDPENSSIKVLEKVQLSKKKKMQFLTIYPGTWKMKVYNFLRVSVTVVTFLSFPFFTSFGGLTGTAFAVFGVTDFFWLLCIILTFLVGIIDNQNGDVITDFKLIAKHYATRFNGLVVDLVALIPFELISVAIGKGVGSANGKHVAWSRIFRLIRGHCFYHFLKSETKRLDNNIYLSYFYMISFVIVALFHSTGIYIALATEPSIVAARNHHELNSDQFSAFVFAFEYVINFVSSTNLFLISPNTKSQLHFFNLNTILYLLLKGILITNILSTLYVHGVDRAFYKSHMLELEFYLKDNDASPSIIREALTYRTNLLQLSRSENMPSLLKNAPSTIRAVVMRNIYNKHLINCPLFKGISTIFLDQLVARATRELYFPGQVIVQQGDVDRRMYFIHSGEVYVITETQDRAYIESVRGIIKAWTSFGEAQGLWLSIPHCYTYRARTIVDLLVLHSNDWMDLRRSFPSITKQIIETAKRLKFI